MTANNFPTTAAVCPSHKELQLLIEAMLANGPAEIVLPYLVQMLGNPVLLQAIINRIGQEEEWMQQVQRASYYHRNGFDKLVLLEGLNYKVRLHHFRPCIELPPAENIHDHRWPFASTIVCGTLHMRMFEPSATGTIHANEYLYDSKKVNGQYDFQFKNKSRLRITEYRKYLAQQYYLMHTHELHQIVYMPGDEALTLVITGKPERETCRLFAINALHDDEKDTQPYTLEFLKDKLAKLAGMI